MTREQAPDIYQVLDEFVRELAPDNSHQIHLIESDQVQASAVAKDILITTAFFEKYADRPDLLRFVVAHEIAHGILEHSLRDYTSAQAKQEVSDQTNDQTHEPTREDMLEELSLDYINRIQERDADLLAIRLLEQAGYSAQAGVDYFEPQVENDMKSLNNLARQLADRVDGMTHEQAKTFVELTYSHPTDDRRLKVFEGAVERQKREGLDLK